MAKPANRDIGAGDLLFLNMKKIAYETNLLGRPRTNLDYKTMGPYPVLANNGHTLDISVEEITERTSSDRIRLAPVEYESAPSPDALTPKKKESVDQGHREPNRTLLSTSKGEKSVEDARDTTVAEDNSESDQEYVIYKIVDDRTEKDGAAEFSIRWFNCAPNEDT